ncbi:hypothetical protein L9F63_007072 [Diploptera punctata]|uniref:Ionotropic glutamate receptor C-terminal domain-containing protein n=1 Tax=Diploptera punctata TaxID=6984 RepID=A0AAD7Z9J6_DIPPU|nr:hypothetical protein L9F63_007072 [Diploptera punctata]
MNHMNLKLLSKASPKGWKQRFTKLFRDLSALRGIQPGFILTYILKYNWYVRQADPYPIWAGITRVFDTYVWICVALSVSLASLIFWILALYSRAENNYNNIFYCALNSWGVIINVGVTMPRGKLIRWVFFIWIIYCLCINTIFQTFFVSFMIDPGRLHQIDTFDEMNDLGYELLSTQSEGFFYDFVGKTRHGLRHVLNEQNAVMLALESSNRSLFINEQLFTRSYYDLCGNNITYRFHKLQGYESFYHMYIMFSNPHIGGKFSKILSQYLQAGIPNMIINKICDPKGTLSLTKRTPVNLEEEYVTISLIHLQSAFYSFIILNCFAIFVFLCEIAIYRLRA